LGLAAISLPTGAYRRRSGRGAEVCSSRYRGLRPIGGRCGPRRRGPVRAGGHDEEDVVPELEGLEGQHLVPERVKRLPGLVLEIAAAQRAGAVARAELVEPAGPQLQQTLALGRAPKGLEAVQRVP
jgi:hypothetical protein